MPLCADQQQRQAVSFLLVFYLLIADEAISMMIAVSIEMLEYIPSLTNACEFLGECQLLSLSHFLDDLVALLEPRHLFDQWNTTPRV